MYIIQKSERNFFNKKNIFTIEKVIFRNLPFHFSGEKIE